MKILLPLVHLPLILLPLVFLSLVYLLLSLLLLFFLPPVLLSLLLPLLIFLYPVLQFLVLVLLALPQLLEILSLFVLFLFLLIIQPPTFLLLPSWTLLQLLVFLFSLFLSATLPLLIQYKLLDLFCYYQTMIMQSNILSAHQKYQKMIAIRYRQKQQKKSPRSANSSYKRRKNCMVYIQLMLMNSDS